jgi:hypothetical protein
MEPAAISLKYSELGPTGTDILCPVSLPRGEEEE